MIATRECCLHLKSKVDPAEKQRQKNYDNGKGYYKRRP